MTEITNRRNFTQNKSEEVVSIIEKMPGRFGYYVSTIVIVLIFLLLLFGYIIKYPEVLSGEFTLTARNEPVKLVANSSGKLQLIKGQKGTKVKEGDYLAVLKNPAQTADVQLLDSLLQNIDIHKINYQTTRHRFPENLSIGELNSPYFNFLNALYQYIDYYKTLPFDNEKEINNQFLNTQKKLITESEHTLSLLEERYHLAYSLYQKDSALQEKKMIAMADFEKTKMAMLSSRQEYQSVNKDILAAYYQTQQATVKSRQLNIEQFNKEKQLAIDMINAYYTIIENIKEWERKYVIIAPFSGIVEFTDFVKNDDYIQAGQELFTIVPAENEMTGQVLLPEQGAGKVQINQDVIIKLINYPYKEYGSVKGKVTDISLVTTKKNLTSGENKLNLYLVSVSLPNGLKTNYNATLPFHYDARGVAEIITNDRRLIERFFDNLKYRTSHE